MPDRLSQRLRELRGEQRQIDVAELSGISQPSITRFENGRQVPRPDQVTALLAVYRAARSDVDELVELAKDMRARRRRLVINRDHGAVQEEISKAQRASALIRSFSPLGISGLLQTPGYINSIFGDDVGGSVRLTGQEILDDAGRQFVFLMPEGSLGWSIADAGRMAEQMAHLSSESRRPNVRLGIIPWGRTVEMLPLNSWEMYDDRAVWTGTINGSTMLTAQADIEPYRQTFGQLERFAVFGGEARAIVESAADRYRSM